MPSPEWIRNLATAKYEQGQWQVPGLEGISIIRRAADELGREMQSTINEFNHHALIRTELFPIAGPSGYHIGFLLVRAGLQIRLEFEQEDQNFTLVGSVIETRDFQIQTRLFTRLIPVADAFGGIGWQAQQGAVWTTDQLIRKILIHLMESTIRTGASR